MSEPLTRACIACAFGLTLLLAVLMVRADWDTPARTSATSSTIVPASLIDVPTIGGETVPPGTTCFEDQAIYYTDTHTLGCVAVDDLQGRP